MIVVLGPNPNQPGNFKVKLGWRPPDLVNGSGIISGYNVYRQGTGTESSWEKLNKIPIQINSYDDILDKPGQYNYAVSTVDSFGAESVRSESVPIQVSNQPNPPTLLTVI